MRRLFILVLLLAGVATLPAQDVRLPMKDGSVKFAVIGDTGTGDSHQFDVAKQLNTYRSKFQFPFVLMMGDNLYSGDAAKDYQKAFEAPYKPLLDAGVKFYASLGNHDNPNERLYKPFNMNGERYYTFKPTGSSVRFFALDSNYVDDKQIEWLDKELADSGSDWKIMFFHHPLYSSGETHGSAEQQRGLLEPVFLKYGVNVVLTGHEHFYERIKPQKGVAYFILGSSAKLRRGDLSKTNLTAKGWDQGYGFLLMEVVGDDLYFQMISDKGETIDTGSVHRVGKTEPTPGRSSQPVQQGPTPPKQPPVQSPAPKQPTGR
jgi:calcineurin-like phosphoesterase family protein